MNGPRLTSCPRAPVGVALRRNLGGHGAGVLVIVYKMKCAVVSAKVVLHRSVSMLLCDSQKSLVRGVGV